MYNLGDGYSFDGNTGVIFYDNKRYNKIGKKGRVLLPILLENKSKVLSREDILNLLKQRISYDISIKPKNISSLITELRTALYCTPLRIRTYHRRGYLLEIKS